MEQRKIAAIESELSETKSFVGRFFSAGSFQEDFDPQQSSSMLNGSLYNHHHQREPVTLSSNNASPLQKGWAR